MAPGLPAGDSRSRTSARSRDPTPRSGACPRFGRMTVVAGEPPGEQVGAALPALQEPVVVLPGGPLALHRVGFVVGAVAVPPRRHLHPQRPQTPRAVVQIADGEREIEVGVAVVATPTTISRSDRKSTRLNSSHRTI